MLVKLDHFPRDRGEYKKTWNHQPDKHLMKNGWKHNLFEGFEFHIPHHLFHSTSRGQLPQLPISKAIYIIGVITPFISSQEVSDFQCPCWTSGMYPFFMWMADIRHPPQSERYINWWLDNSIAMTATTRNLKFTWDGFISAPNHEENPWMPSKLKKNRFNGPFMWKELIALPKSKGPTPPNATPKK